MNSFQILLLIEKIKNVRPITASVNKQATSEFFKSKNRNKNISRTQYVLRVSDSSVMNKYISTKDRRDIRYTYRSIMALQIKMNLTLVLAVTKTQYSHFATDMPILPMVSINV